MVLLLGQYSVGKTSFIEYLLERKFPGQRIGPEPTTDMFTAVMYGEEEMIIPGNALTIQKDKPFHALSSLGTNFLSRFTGSICQAPLLERISLIDSPGVLSGEKQRSRSYEFTDVVQYFTEKCDLILLLFDAHKLDISDEFKAAIETLRGHDDKVRVVLNKADKVTPQQLMRVYGALMWSLGKVISTPEVMRVYIGSFWDKPYENEHNKELFEAEQRDLLEDLRGLPRNSAVRKVNELVKRARLAKVHAYLIGHFRKEMPAMFGKENKKRELIENIREEFLKVMRQYKLTPGDFPDIKKFQEKLKDKDFTKFAKLNIELITQLEDVLSRDIPDLMQRISPPANESGADLNPFAEPSPDEWASVERKQEEYKDKFEALNPSGGKVAGAAARPFLVEFGLQTEILRRIWTLSDVDKDGALDFDEFSLALHLIDQVKNNPVKTLPTHLPSSLVPPGKRV